MAKSFVWRDGHEIYHTSTGHLRRILRKPVTLLHKSVQKWERAIQWNPNPDSLWKNIWRPYCSARQNCFLWQVAFNIPTTNHWRFPGISRSDPATWCLCCPLRLHEDLLHLLWNFPAAKPIWSWVQNILKHVDPRAVNIFSFTAAQALLGIPLGPLNGCNQRWWHILRTTTCWEIWKARCSLVMSHTHINTISLRIKAWTSLRTHLKAEWDTYKLKIKLDKITQEDAEKSFKKTFGCDKDVFYFIDYTLVVAQTPPRIP